MLRLGRTSTPGQAFSLPSCNPPDWVRERRTLTSTKVYHISDGGENDLTRALGGWCRVQHPSGATHPFATPLPPLRSAFQQRGHSLKTRVPIRPSLHLASMSVRADTAMQVLCCFHFTHTQSVEAWSHVCAGGTCPEASSYLIVLRWCYAAMV